jgi:4-amino-4-deoxy-L-arabinose transferase-like glycosyltransferase
VVFVFGGGVVALAIIQVVISSITCLPVYLAAKEYAGKSCGIIAAGLMALNITAIANAPLLLSDTLFAFFAAWQLYFFLKYCTDNRLKTLLTGILIAAAATLIRPVNQLLIVVLCVLILCRQILPWKKRLLHALCSILLFAAVITPWMLRNYACGADFDIDSNTGAMRHQNGAMLMAKINGTDFESEKKKLLASEAAAFTDRKRFPDERSKEKWRKQEFRNMVMEYPVTYFFQHLDAGVLLPDAPTLLENFGVTSSDRGTMGVLKKDGIFAAVKHYFGENWFWHLLFLLPLLLPAAILYFAVGWQLFRDIRQFKSRWFELLLLLGLAEYYLFLPGSITAPRYQLPALPLLCTIAAAALSNLLNRKNVKKTAPADSAQK